MKNYQYILLKLPWLAVLVLISVIMYYGLEKSDTAGKSINNTFEESTMQDETKNQYYFVSDKNKPITSFTQNKLDLIKSINTALDANDYNYVNSKIYISDEAHSLTDNILKLDTTLTDEYSLYKSLIPPREDIFSKGFFLEPKITFFDPDGDKTSPIGFFQKGTPSSQYSASVEYITFIIDEGELKIDLSSSIITANDFLIWTINKNKAKETS